MTVGGNLAYPAENPQAARRRSGRQVKRALGMVKLDKFANRYPARCPAASSSAWRWRGAGVRAAAGADGRTAGRAG